MSIYVGINMASPHCDVDHQGFCLGKITWPWGGGGWSYFKTINPRQVVVAPSGGYPRRTTIEYATGSNCSFPSHPVFLYMGMRYSEVLLTYERAHFLPFSHHTIPRY